MNSTMRPRPPPKPSHLATIRTGNGNTEAFRTYIRQHREGKQGANRHITKSACQRSERGTDESYDTCVDRRSEDSNDNDNWRTAKQPFATPHQHQHPALADMFQRSPSQGCEEAQDQRKSCEVLIKVDTETVTEDTFGEISSAEKHEHGETSPKGQDAEGEHAEMQRSDNDVSRDVDDAEGRIGEEEPAVKAVAVTIVEDEIVDAQCDYKDDTDVEAASEELQGDENTDPTVDKPPSHASSASTTSASALDDTATRPLNDLITSSEALQAGLPKTSSVLPTLRLTPFPIDPSATPGSSSPCGLKLYCESDAKESDKAMGSRAPTTPLSASSSRFLAHRPDGPEARALFDFTGQAQNELTLAAGQSFVVLSEDPDSKWTRAAADIDGIWTKGLVPFGWYTTTQEMAKPPDVGSSTSSSGHIRAGSPSRLDKPRPASGIGEMLRSPPDAPTAFDKLTQMSQALQVPESGVFSHESGSSQPENGATSPIRAVAPSTPVVSQQRPFPTASRGTMSRKLFGTAAPFVTTGAEKYILCPDERSDSTLMTADRHEVISGDNDMPCWKPSEVQVSTLVSSPEVASGADGREYVTYLVHSSFVFEGDEDVKMAPPWRSPQKAPRDPSATLSVFRRYNQFRWLASHLTRCYPLLMHSLPPFPAARHALTKGARFDPTMVDCRRRHLQIWLTAVSRHAVLSQTTAVRFFLDSEEEQENWSQEARRIEDGLKRDAQNRIEGDLLFRQVSYAFFGFEADEARQELDYASKFAASYERAMSDTERGILTAYRSLRQGTSTEAEQYRELSCAMLRLLTGVDSNVSSGSAVTNALKATSAPVWQGPNLPPMGRIGVRDGSGATNEERAWCWRENCQDCHRLTRALQKVAEAWQGVADVHEASINGDMLDVHEQLWTSSRAQSQQQALFETHRSALSLYEEANKAQEAADSVFAPPSTEDVSPSAGQVAARCEDVMNVTLAEMDRIHTERIQEWSALSRDMLDEQIERYESVLAVLRDARSRVDEVIPAPQSDASGADVTRAHAQEASVATVHPCSPVKDSFTGPILPSPYESQLYAARQPVQLIVPDMPLTAPSTTAALATRPVDTLVEWMSGGYI